MNQFYVSGWETGGWGGGWGMGGGGVQGEGEREGGQQRQGGCQGGGRGRPSSAQAGPDVQSLVVLHSETHQQ